MSSEHERLFESADTLQGRLERLGAHAYLSILALLTAGPYVMMILISLMGEGWQPVTPPKLIPDTWSFVNYTNVWVGNTALLDEPFVGFFVNSIIYAGGATLIILAIDTLAGYAFARLEFRGRDITFLAIVSTLMITPMILFIPVYTWFNQFGLVNTRLGIILPHTYSAFGVFLMRQFIKTLPSDLEDAALIDGCSRFGVFWRIVVPMLKPALVTLGIITFITVWNSFLWPLILARDSALFNLPVALGFFQGQTSTLWAPLMAATAITLVPMVILFVSMQQYYVRGFVVGGLKG
ncbi:sugar ABC transporter ATP-binding protein [Haloarcula mannanilytica]|uniref:Sugar ABC transporter ATP-binding protein n=1 Tax=Haloarcula mannanilytica TaxID=2509225 RepID=A0A4C2EIT8_9EURY|nr:carbohydrate ABC transporter permease [Haloarcula mannanilytica]GCF14411.1 sugar ABC transporter ATP-binding protein [Haloarcula mannanilytica]